MKYGLAKKMLHKYITLAPGRGTFTIRPRILLSQSERKLNST